MNVLVGVDQDSGLLNSIQILSERVRTENGLDSLEGAVYNCCVVYNKERKYK